MIRRLLSAITLMICFSNGYSQSSIYLGASLDGGVPVANTYGQNKSIIKQHPLAYHLGGNFSVQWRFKDRFAIEAGVGQAYDSWRLKDANFESRYPGFIVKLANRSYTWSYFANVSYVQEIDPNNVYLYAQVGYSFNNSASNTLTQEKEFNKVQQGIKERLTATTTYFAQNNSIIPEIGIQKYVGDKHMISAGIKLNLGSSAIASGNYEVYNMVDSTTIHNDTYNSKGSFLGFTIKYSYLLHHIPKKEKPPKKPKEKPIEQPDTTTVVVNDPPVDTTSTQPVDTTQYNEREIDVTHKVKVHSPTVKVRVWDHQMVDGDRVSLNLNGEYVLENYTLQKKVYEFEINLNEGLNQFVLHALNLGRFEPNTAAIIIVDGDKEHKIVLESTLEKSGTIEITYKPKKDKDDDD